MLPTEGMRHWVWENYWLIFATTAYLVAPWLLVVMTIPHLFDVYSGASAGPLAAIALFGAGWGAGGREGALQIETTASPCRPHQPFKGTGHQVVDTLQRNRAPAERLRCVLAECRAYFVYFGQLGYIG